MRRNIRRMCLQPDPALEFRHSRKMGCQRLAYVALYPIRPARGLRKTYQGAGLLERTDQRILPPTRFFQRQYFTCQNNTAGKLRRSSSGSAWVKVSRQPSSKVINSGVGGNLERPCRAACSVSRLITL